MINNRENLVSISSMSIKNQGKMMNEKSRSSHQEVSWKNSSSTFCKIYRKAPVVHSLFNTVESL